MNALSLQVCRFFSTRQLGGVEELAGSVVDLLTPPVAGLSAEDGEALMRSGEFQRL